MKLYLLDGCPYAHRASIALGEKGVPFEVIAFEQGRRPAELEALGPRAKSPTLFDGGRGIYESSVVIEYIDEAYPSPPLLPADPGLRAEVRMFQARVSEELMPKYGALISEVLLKPERDSAKIAEAKRAFVEALPAWERHFTGRSFAVTEELTLADITFYTPFPSVERFAGLTVPTELTALRAFLARMAARASAAFPRPSSGRRLGAPGTSAK